MHGRGEREPLEVRLTLRFKFGDADQDAVTVMDDRRLPLTGSVFDSRDRIMRGFMHLLIRAGLSQPRVVREVLPVLGLLRRVGRKP